MRSIGGIGLLALVGVVVASVHWPRELHAESPPVNAAEEHVKRGVALRRSGNDVAALREFQKAWDIVQTPRTSAQLGLCQQSLGQWAPAQARLLEALAAKDDTWVSRNRLALENALASARQHIGHVMIVGDPKGAEVLIGGRVVGTFPLGDPIAVSEGTVDVEVRAPHFQAATRSVKVDAGQFVDLVVRLTRHPANETAANAVPKFSPTDASNPAPNEGGLGIRAPDETTGPSAPFYQRSWFWVTAGVVVVGAVVVGVLASGGNETTYPTADKTGKGF